MTTPVYSDPDTLPLKDSGEKRLEEARKLASEVIESSNKRLEELALKDSGERANYETGAVRDTNASKGRFDLLPAYVITRLAKHYEKGAKKYAARNWEKGIPLQRYMDSALRHLFNHQDGQRDEDHMAAALWNIAGYIETEERIRRGVLPATLDDTQPSTNLHKDPEKPS